MWIVMWTVRGAATALGITVGAATGLADEIATGRAIAEKHCSRCHVIGDFNKFGGIGSTPSFQLLVNAFDDWQERFETFQARRPHPSFVRVAGFDYPDPDVFPPNASPVEIELDDIAAVRAFAETLKKK
jgi:hypothetical protein